MKYADKPKKSKQIVSSSQSSREILAIQTKRLKKKKDSVSQEKPKEEEKLSKPPVKKPRKLERKKDVSQNEYEFGVWIPINECPPPNTEDWVLLFDSLYGKSKGKTISPFDSYTGNRANEMLAHSKKRKEKSLWSHWMLIEQKPRR
jgi:hypothetical protein